jgi:hypothetical protein
MTTFDDREKGFETKYQRDQEFQFKVTARRNKLLGLWMAEKLGLAGAEADSYAKDVVVADFQKPGDHDVVEKVMADVAAKGLDVAEKDVRREMARLLDVAREQLAKEA